MSFSSHKVTTPNGETTITVFVPGSKPLVAQDSHPNFAKIVEKVEAGDESVVDLFNVTKYLNDTFRSLSDRMAVRGTTVYYDEDPVDNSLTKQIFRFLEAGEDDWKPLVAFFEKVVLNPQEHSRTQLYDFLERNDFSLTPDGDIIAYKGVKKYDENEYRSTTAGVAYVNGVKHEGYIPNAIGDVITMPRTDVAQQPHVACSTGLHIATYNFAKQYGTVLEVHVNPRDIVSVPTDGGGEKVRCCRYKVVGVKNAPYQEVVVEVSTDDSATDTPTEKQWNEVVAEAKSRKKGVQKVAEKYWTLVGDDPKDRESWSTLAPPENPPSPAEWDDYTAEAKSRKKGVASILKKYGYELVGSDPKNRLHYEFNDEN